MGSRVRGRQPPGAARMALSPLLGAPARDIAAGLCFPQGRGGKKAEGLLCSRESKSLAKCSSQYVNLQIVSRGSPWTLLVAGPP